MNKDNFTVTYKLKTKIETSSRAIDLLLAEMTGGIHYYPTQNSIKMFKCEEHVPFVDDSIKGEVLTVKEESENSIIITYSLPSTNLSVSIGGITNLWSIIAGEVFNFHFIESASLIDFTLSDSFSNYYNGPAFGIRAIREILKIKNRPLFGTIIKPNLGLDAEKTAAVAYNLAYAGFDFIKDDEICVNPELSPLKTRVKLISEMIDKVKQITGRNILYAANITSDAFSLSRAAESALENGASALMIDPFCTGFTAIDYLKRTYKVPIYAHRVGYGLYCNNSRLNIKFSVFCKLFRLLGADFSHVGTLWGKSESDRDQLFSYVNILRKEASNKQTWPVVTGISLDNMNEYHQFFGNDSMFMEHIDIYGDVASAEARLRSLKEQLDISHAQERKEQG